MVVKVAAERRLMAEAEINFKKLKPIGRRQALFLQESAVEEPRLVARSRVREDRHHGVPGTKIAREADRARDVDAARAPQAQAFILQQIKNQRCPFRSASAHIESHSDWRLA